jgi:glucose/arabinose dehydrogenase
MAKCARNMERSLRFGFGLGFFGALSWVAVVSCSDTPVGAVNGDGGARDGAGEPRDALPPLEPDAMLANSYCALPGSVVSTTQGMAVVAGGDPSLPDMSWLTVPVGYCVHHFANVPETRQLRVSPSGDLFVASPSASTAGSERKTGLGAILVLPDDDHDGLADSQIQFLPEKGATTGLSQTQGLTFRGGYFYYQDSATIRRLAFAPNDRAPSAPSEPVTTITVTQSSDHWPKVFDMAQDGSFYVTNGSDQGEGCLTTRPPIGAVFQVGPDGIPSVVTKGFRNPIALRCEDKHNVCLVAELAKDGSGGAGGREKLVPVHQGDDWGFPCCATTNVPYSGMEFQDNGQFVKPSDCAGVTQETVSFEIGHTPFGIDFETSAWQAPWTDRAFVALHGDVGTYIGSRVVAVALDPTTGLPLPSSDLGDGSSGAPNMMDFVTGWDDGHQDHGRATAVAFGLDGRLYVGDDTFGEIFWVAPVTLLRPNVPVPEASPADASDSSLDDAFPDDAFPGDAFSIDAASD